MASLTVRLLACVAVLTLAGCSTKAAQAPVVTVTVTPTTTGVSTTPSSSATASTIASTPVAIPIRHLIKLPPGGCDALLPLAEIETALGRAVKGGTAFVVGVAEQNTGRLAYLNCRYGLPAGAAHSGATPKLEIGVSLYRTSAQAAQRISATVDDYTNHHATATQTIIGDVTATVLTGGTGTNYAAATIVAAAGQRTVAISIAADATTDPTNDLTTLAGVALDKTS